MKRDLKHFPSLAGLTYCITDPGRRATVESVIKAYRERVVPMSANFRHGVIHGDFNDGNIILTADGQDVKGVIDFSDAAHSWLVNEPAIAMCYAMTTSFAKESGDPLGAAALLLREYHAANPLSGAESMHLRDLVAARLATSATMALRTMMENPSNDFVNTHANEGWMMLDYLWNQVPAEHTKALWQKAIMQVPPDVIMQVSAHVSKSLWVGGKRKREEAVPVTFVTGNANKLKEVKQILGACFPFPLENRKVDLPELQGEPLDIAREKCRLAALEVGGPVMVEDTGLCFNALGGLPGPYIKWFLDKVGHQGLNNMLEGGDGGRGAYAQCVFAFTAGPGEEVQIFDGRTPGTVVPPRGPLGFGWDPIFQPEGYELTYAEMEKEEKNKISHRGKALAMLKDYAEANIDAVIKSMREGPPVHRENCISGMNGASSSDGAGGAGIGSTNPDLKAFGAGQVEAGGEGSHAANTSKTDETGEIGSIMFVTGNEKKLKEVEQILGRSFPFPLKNKKIDLPELQGEPLDIAKEKCRLAAQKVRGPVIVEDTGLCFNALGGLPGPYIKWFLDKVGHQGLNNMLEGGDRGRGAYAQCVFAFTAGPGEEVQVFDGRTPGTIVQARGPPDFGWDPIFQPEGYKLTYAEMEKGEKNKISHRGKALAMLKVCVSC
ncbi:unnamed protein product, partial [Discosporangium mesarthrocarpum]